MVSTNFGCWSQTRPEIAVNSAEQQNLRPVISHISSNGYYGYEVNNNNTNGNNYNHGAENNIVVCPDSNEGKVLSVGGRRCKRRFVDVSQSPFEASKRGRLGEATEDFTTQYSNGLFLLPSTQLEEDSCAMDTTDGTKQQIDAFISTNPENSNFTSCSFPILSEQQQNMQTNLEMQVERQTQQQHYQAHLHRANRDVSRCLLSHMI